MDIFYHRRLLLEYYFWAILNLVSILGSTQIQPIKEPEGKRASARHLNVHMINWTIKMSEYLAQCGTVFKTLPGSQTKHAQTRQY